jgi:hypothetical protein
MESLGVDIVGIVMNDIRAEIDYTQGNFQHYQYRYEPEAEPVGVLSRAGQRLRGIFSGRGGRTG